MSKVLLSPTPKVAWTYFQHPARLFSFCFFCCQLTLNNFLSFEHRASTIPVKIASWLLPMHRKCCHNVVDHTQCIESRYVVIFWNLSIPIMMTVFWSKRKGVFVHFVCIFVPDSGRLLFVLFLCCLCFHSHLKTNKTTRMKEMFVLFLTYSNARNNILIVLTPFKDKHGRWILGCGVDEWPTEDVCSQLIK